RPEVGLVEGAEGDFLEQVQRIALERGRPLLPAMREDVPFLVLNVIPAIDAGIGVDTLHMRELRIKLDNPLLQFLLSDALRRNCRGERHDIRIQGARDPSLGSRTYAHIVQHLTPPWPAARLDP